MNWTIAKHHEGLMIRTYLQQEHQFSKRMMKQIIHNGGEIRVNEVKQTVRYVLKAGDVLTVTLPEEKKGSMMIPEKMPLDIVYEDDTVLVIKKPAGRATIPSYLHSSGTIANGVLAHYEQQNLPYTFHVVTRLDRNTSGIMLIAKHRWGHSLLSEAQKKGKIKRAYYAIIEGHLQQKKGTINAPIDRKEGSIIERKVSHEGKHATTHYTALKESNDHTLVHVQLETGRTHQIRVHFSYIGHPLAGDDLYGGVTSFISRQALHCHHLSFEHPITNEQVDFSAEMADDMKQMV
ncbi:23S rRNA pseudouridine1911/1915/1917 synthase [Lentibacillus halodurans]|uniref:Pseudouridine synthase n=1 Tax=Lentibacillus halodurans TaxID=237679 RepID=A0A1I0W275_9BACI|nr:RluA family pseudouridine synthase [Lentibacillus halodurans]SFA82701.1 23S rRNA pseudouridine1911/1915/1917 synthase [Lentibacillus halodurans]